MPVCIYLLQRFESMLEWWQMFPIAGEQIQVCSLFKHVNDFVFEIKV